MVEQRRFLSHINKTKSHFISPLSKGVGTVGTDRTDTLKKSPVIGAIYHETHIYTLRRGINFIRYD